MTTRRRNNQLLCAAAVVCALGLWSSAAEAGPRIVGGPVETEDTGERPEVAADSDGPQTAAAGSGAIRVGRIDPRPWVFDVGFGLQGFGAFDDWIEHDGFAEAFGLVFVMRWRAKERLALVLDAAVTGRESESGATTEVRGQHSIGVQYMPWPSSSFEPFVGGGLTAAFAEVETLRTGIYDYGEFGAYMSLGIDIDIEWGRLVNEFRAMKLHRFDDDDLSSARSSGRYTRTASDERWAVLGNISWHWGW